MPKPSTLVMTGPEVAAHIEEIFPNSYANGWTFRIEDLAPMAVRVRMPFEQRNLRPGGTISGPAIFHLADYSIWVAIIGMVGKPGVDAVTSNLNVNFLRKPAPDDMIARGRIVKLGRRLVMGDVEITSEGREDMVAHATVTYAMP